MGHTQYTLQHRTTNTTIQCNEEQQIHNTHYNVEQQIQINNTMKNNKYRSHINTNRNDTHHHLIDGVHNVVHLSPAIETIKSLPLSVFQTFKNHLSMEKQELVES